MAGVTPGAKLDLLVFKITRYVCALDIRAVVEVVLIPALVESPVQAAFLDGFLNLRGTVVPVVPLTAILTLPTAPPELHTPIIVIETAGRPVAIRVDRVDQVVEVSRDAIQRFSNADSLNGCAEGQVNVAGSDVVVLSGDRLLLREEQALLEDLQARVQKRIENLKDVCR